MADQKLVLGIDCGGTKTVALLANERGEVLGRGYAGAGNSSLVGNEGALAAVEQAALEAFLQAGQPRRKIAALCLGMAGMDRPAEKEWFAARLRRMDLAAQVELSNDARLLLAAGTPEGWGVGAISGTGSIAFGISQDGRQARAGGWGYILGDEGSGYDLGRQALRAVARAADGRGPATLLTGLVLAHWSLPQPGALIPYVYHTPVKPAGIAQLAPLVDEATAAGDAVASAILAAAAGELALGLAAVVRSLGFQGAAPCALGGGVFLHMPVLREQVARQVLAGGTELAPLCVVSEPAQGAVRIAARLASTDKE